MAAASSRSLFVTVPEGVAEVMRAFWMCVAKGARQTAAIVEVMKKPPIPSFDASVAPKESGGRGTTVNKGTGCVAAVVARCFHAPKVACTRGVRRIRVPFAEDRAYCKKEK
jgi:hypothetical protein